MSNEPAKTIVLKDLTKKELTKHIATNLVNSLDLDGLCMEVYKTEERKLKGLRKEHLIDILERLWVSTDSWGTL